MKHILLAFMLLFTVPAFAETDEKVVVPESVVFEGNNFFAVTSQFGPRLLDSFSEKVLTYDGKKMFIYFESPGGSVIALSRMARIMKGSGINFTCIANFAASAAFMLFQHCNTRLLLSDGILMSHNWSGGFQGEGPRILTQYFTVQNIVDDLEAVIIDKLNVNKLEYDRLINSNLWMTRKLALKYDAIDGILTKITCSKRLLNLRKKVRVYGYYRNGFKDVFKSGCPLIQKVYTKKYNNSDEDEYIETNSTWFDIAQKSYQMGNANWIYLGDRNN